MSLKLQTDVKKGCINLGKFKSLAENKLPHDSPLYKVVASEQDELSVDSFISKSEVWLRLIDITFPRKG